MPIVIICSNLEIVESPNQEKSLILSHKNVSTQMAYDLVIKCNGEDLQRTHFLAPNQTLHTNALIRSNREDTIEHRYKDSKGNIYIDTFLLKIRVFDSKLVTEILILDRKYMVGEKTTYNII